MITAEELIKIARLAKLSLAGEDTGALVREMADIMDIANSIDEVDLSVYNCASDSEDAPLRDDVVMPSLLSEMILSNAGEKRGGYFAGLLGGRRPE